jgi:surfeit locus 1 family protein
MSKRSIVLPTIAAGVGIAVLLGLGSWQVERLHWKTALIAERRAAVVAPPVALRDDVGPIAPLAFHRVSVEGIFDHGHELYVLATAQDGAAGFHVVTPLRRPGGSIVLIDRGFVPSSRRDGTTRAAGELQGHVTVTGVLRPAAGKSSWFVPDNRPRTNEWFYVDLPAMAAAIGAGTVAPYYIEADATPNPGGYPIGGQTVIDLPNNHLQYALTWYALAGGLAVIYILFVRQRRAEEKP